MRTIWGHKISLDRSYAMYEQHGPLWTYTLTDDCPESEDMYYSSTCHEEEQITLPTGWTARVGQYGDLVLDGPGQTILASDLAGATPHTLPGRLTDMSA